MATPTQARRWAKTGATQQRILYAATEVFATRGFTAATMADVVAGSGASVGSIYHHFGGKNELFLAIFEQMATAVDRRIEEAMRQAGEAADPRRIFELHVRAYLEAMWENRHLARVLTSGDTPPGFEVARRDRMQAAFRRWMAVLELDKSVRGQLLSRILVATMAESSLMVAGCEDPDEVPAITDATIEWIGQLTE
ncbi:TetR family transcriptional regulator [Mycobacterium sp. 852002-50816_SCH5313054-b]|uniref:TetR/AcrR family transcriptional regulator n=1 Tax=Mycobacterium sp. 852002-50816_SCH5313054-b TaxID=1834092 RepID=UPI0008004207|nr:TetR/AcrR family transcriptional regulator [Mycobacterium sp. 852002-50816_SCH5313054-b]OBF57071.1 TetR family transcriptional regulator [Mycobacterium sp. 852002-50816_SCH5313054-b]